MRMTPRQLAAIAPALILALAGPPAMGQEKAPASLPPDRAAALDRISGDSLKGHLSFLASDLLEGRDTPSRGLDLAAEYIAAQFRQAGLEPIGGDGYFQAADWEIAEPDPASFRLEFAGDGPPIGVPADRVSLAWLRGHDIAPAGLIKVDFRHTGDLQAGQVEGKAVLVELPDLRRVDRADRARVRREIEGFRARMTALRPALVVEVARDGSAASGPLPRLIDPLTPEASEPAGDEPPSPPTLAVHDPAVVALFDARPTGPGRGTASVRLGTPPRRPVTLRNVVGLLRGSDPALKGTYVMVTAHYDHVGVRGPAGTDRIYNGANDDGSGTVSVVELASSLATLKERPRRSLVFATFFGEEHGLLGSRYYGRHPLVPVEKTVADVNLEQVGRTDSSEGPQVGTASLTGFGFSGVSTAFAAAGLAEGIKVYKHPTNSDAYFGASDNQALADLGVPAHTLCVAFQYPDYHGAADHWEKVDYANMARVDRMVGRALLAIADDPEEPRWDESNPKAAKYLKAWKDRRGR